MRTIVLALALAAIGGAGCRSGGPPPPPPPHPGAGGDHQVINANAVFGNASVTALMLGCAGRTTLAQGVAVVNDGCFSGDTNVVLCTDASAPNPVMCAPHKGSLAVAGTGADTINYARIR
jgi:hypothetical protein